jgi:hypothetical protein
LQLGSSWSVEGREEDEEEEEKAEEEREGEEKGKAFGSGERRWLRRNDRFRKERGHWFARFHFGLWRCGNAGARFLAWVSLVCCDRFDGDSIHARASNGSSKSVQRCDDAKVLCQERAEAGGWDGMISITTVR